MPNVYVVQDVDDYPSAPCRGECGVLVPTDELYLGYCECCQPHELCDRCEFEIATYVPRPGAPAWDLALCDHCSDDHGKYLYYGGYGC